MPQSASGLTFYDEQFELGLTQGLSTNFALFNANSGGAIVLAGGAKKGLVPKHTYFKHVAGLIQQRDPQGVGALTPSLAINAERSTIKMFFAAPLDFRSQDWEDLGMDEQTGTRLFGVSFGEALAEMYVKSAISAALGAIQAIGAGALHDVSATAKLDFGVLNVALGLFGDRRPALQTMVGHSAVYTDLNDQLFTSQQIAAQIGSTAIYNGGMPTLGMRPIQTDAAPLLVSGSPDKYWTLALQAGGIQIKAGPTRRVFSYVPGDASSTPENQLWRISVEGSYELDILGVTWTGAAKPNDAALATPGNWNHTGGDNPVKHGPGVLIRTQ